MSAPRLTAPMKEALLLLADSQYRRLPVSQESHRAVPHWDVYVNATTAHALTRRGLVALTGGGRYAALTDAGCAAVERLRCGPRRVQSHRPRTA